MNGKNYNYSAKKNSTPPETSFRKLYPSNKEHPVTLNKKKLTTFNNNLTLSSQSSSDIHYFCVLSSLHSCCKLNTEEKSIISNGKCLP